MVSYVEKKIEIISRFGKSSKDTGSTEVQIALLSERIDYLRSHFLKNAKDHHGRRGLLRMVAQRRRLLKYLKKCDELRYISVVKLLKLRH